MKWILLLELNIFKFHLKKIFIMNLLFYLPKNRIQVPNKIRKITISVI